MVVALLVNRYAPASRGLRKSSNNRSRDDSFVSSSGGGSASLDYYHHHNSDSQFQQSIAGHRKKPFKATAFLTSLASDFDVISDWLFLRKSYHNEHVYQVQREEGEASTPPHLIPPLLLWATIFFTLLGTLMWLILATDGRMIMPATRWLGYDKLSIGHVLFLCVLLEDIPQVILTFLIEDYYEKTALSNLAVVNVTISIYDSMIKLAEAYDERHDIVETGQWCKESLWAHHDVVTSILSLPLPPSATLNGPMIEITEHSLNASNINQQPLTNTPPRLPLLNTNNITSGTFRKTPPPKNSSSSIPRYFKKSSSSSSHEPQESSTTTTDKRTYQMHRKSVLNDALNPIAPMKLPRLRFLTTSLDKTVRLWDTAATVSGHRREKCIRVFRGHSDGVTSVALLGSRPTTHHSYYHEISTNNKRRNTSKTTAVFDDDEEEGYNTFFITGCEFGDLKLWNLIGDCLRTYAAPTVKVSVSGITIIKPGLLFAACYLDGSVRLWDVWSTLCLGIYRGHCDAINCICSLQDGKTFVTGSKDETLKLWNVTAAIQKYSQRMLQQNNNNNSAEEGRNSSTMTDALRLISLLSSQPIYEEHICEKTFGKTTGEVLCVSCVEPSLVLVAGYADGIARVWEVESGICLKTFEGHYDAVTAVETVDRVTILTGSMDRSVKVWDVMSATCLRTYVDHNDFISSISMTHDEHTFLTASGDRTVKMWVITSVLPTDRDNHGLIRRH